MFVTGQKTIKYGSNLCVCSNQTTPSLGLPYVFTTSSRHWMPPWFSVWTLSWLYPLKTNTGWWFPPTHLKKMQAKFGNLHFPKFSGWKFVKTSLKFHHLITYPLNIDAWFKWCISFKGICSLSRPGPWKKSLKGLFSLLNIRHPKKLISSLAIGPP